MSYQASRATAATGADRVSTMAADRLSALSDRALQCVISFLKVGDAARTSILSRRWRTLWRQADTLNLDTRSYWDVGYDGKRAGKLLFRDAMGAVHADGRCPVRKLSIDVDSFYQNDYLEDVMQTLPGMDALLAAPAMQCLEEFRLVLSAEFCQTGNEYVLPASRLPWSSLRALKLGGCTLGPPGAAVFDNLETLEMAMCNTALENLQGLINAAPNLRSLWLQRISLISEELGLQRFDVMSKRRVLLRCPNTLVDVTLMHCHSTNGLDLDAPNVRLLRYRGYLPHFPFNPTMPSGQPTNLQEVHLKLCSRCYNEPSTGLQTNAMFWESIGGFSHLRVLKLKVQDINDIVVHLDQEQRLLKQFPNLKYLEVTVSSDVVNHGTAIAIANLLHYFPAMHEFRLRFKLLHMNHGTDDQMRALLHLEKSMESFRRLMKSQMDTSPRYDILNIVV